MVISMYITESDQPASPYNAPRGSCPDCGSGEVRHVVAGPFEDRSQVDDPQWVDWRPDLVIHCDRECETCGLEWSCEREPLSPVRLVSVAGAAFGLVPVPLLDESHRVSVDIELLSPDRIVRYLNRTFAPSSIAILRDFWMKAAKDTHPELTVPSVEENEARLSISILHSTATVVTLEFTIVSDLTSDLPEHDGLAFDMFRSDLIDAAFEIAEWNDEDWEDEGWDV